MSRIIRGDVVNSLPPATLGDLDGLTEAQAGSFVVAPMAARSTEEGVTGSDVDEAPAPSVIAAEPAADSGEDVGQQRYDEGFRAGQAEAEERFGGACAALASACEELANLKANLLQRSGDDMLRLVLSIARKVVATELALQPEVIKRTVERAIQAAVRAEEYHIKVNPQDLQVVQEHKPLFIASLSGLSNIEFVPDSSISPGGCIVESPLGRVDATIEAQLEEISACLDEAIRDEQ